jgi:hypothetical protein
MRKRLLILFITSLGGFYTTLAQAPIITDFTPKSGPVGTTVTITGTNLSTTNANCIAYFGAVRAQVTAATSTSLTAIVPTGATYQPITVTVNGLTGYSRLPFIVTFVGVGAITNSSFSPRVDFATGSYPRGVAIGDVDGDGKPDLAVANTGSNTVSVFRNTQMTPHATIPSPDTAPPSLVIIEPTVARGMRLNRRTLVVRGKATDESGIFEAKINDNEANLFATGEFWAEIRLALGENSIRVTAVDMKGNTAEQIITIVREAETVAPPPTPGNALDIGEYHALVIAVNEYEDTRIQPLLSPVKDAEQLISVLTRKYGFRSSNIRFLRNPTRAEIISAFTRLQGVVQGSENVLVFYAGHGYWNDAIKQ